MFFFFFVAACLVVDDTDPLAIHSRTEELKLRKEQYWYVIYSHNGFIMAQFTCLFSIFIASLRNEVGSFTLTFMQFVCCGVSGPNVEII